jgi:hypothetical protein
MTQIQSLEEIADLFVAQVTKDAPVHNLFEEFTISINDIKEHSLQDVNAEAKKWIEPKCPESLHINHGEYIGDGMQHIIEELTKKPASNRALYSLINNSDIIGSGDAPIPSFLIFQTKIIDNTLHATVYFRALEVAKFLRINLEEIRFRLEEIQNSITTITDVRLGIFAFYAYCNAKIEPLVRPNLDRLNSPQLALLIREKHPNLKKFLDEKSKVGTVIELESINLIKEIINCDPPKRLEASIKKVKLLIQDCLDKGEQLKLAREKQSDNSTIDELSELFTSSINSLSGALCE